jgi:hypothetical protein
VSILYGTYSLLGIADVEAFTARIIQRSQLDELSAHDREELHAYLISECWRESTRFEPGGITFSTLAGHVLRRRVTDWKRARYGRTVWKFRTRTYIRPTTIIVSLDADDPERGRLVDTLATQTSDPAADSNTDLAGLLADGSRTRARDLLELGLEPHE